MHDSKVNFHIGIASVRRSEAYCHPAHDQHLRFLNLRFQERCPEWHRGTPLLTVGATTWIEGIPSLKMAPGVGRARFSAKNYDADIDVFVEERLYREIDEDTYRQNLVTLLEEAFDRLATRIAKRAPEIDVDLFYSVFRFVFRDYREALIPIVNPKVASKTDAVYERTIDLYFEFKTKSDRARFCEFAEPYGFTIEQDKIDGLYLCTLSRTGSSAEYHDEINALCGLCLECNGEIDGYSS